MAFDTLLKRYFGVVIVALIAIAAYFQAAGVSSCVGSRLAVDANALAAGASVQPPGPGSASAAPDPHSRVGDAVISRNPFDSVTGALIRPDTGAPDADAPLVVDFSDPYHAPDCDGTQLVLITASDDPTWSMAVLGSATATTASPAPPPAPGATSSPSGSKTQLRRIGDPFGTKRVWFITWDRVWLHGDGQLCQVRMFKPPAPPASSVAVGPAPAGGAPTVPSDIASKIQKIGPNEYNIDRAVVDKILENQAELMKSARIVPEQENGKTVGVRVFGVRPDTLLGALGMQNGDRLDAINGFSMGSPEKALEAYARLRTAPHLTISVNRGGKPTNIDFNIK